MNTDNLNTTQEVNILRNIANIKNHGALALLDSLIIDLSCSQKIFNVELSVIEKLSDALNKLSPHDREKSINADRYAVSTIDNFILHTLVAHPSHHYSTYAAEKIRAFRGIVVDFHIKRNLEIPKKLCSALNKIQKCSDLSYLQYLDELNLNTEHLKKTYENTKKESSFKQIYATLIAYFQIGQKPAETSLRKRVAVKEKKERMISNTNKRPDENQSEHGKPPKTQSEAKECNDLLRYLLTQYSRKPRLVSGVWNLDTCLHPLEFVDFMGIVSRQFIKHHDEISLAILLNALFGVTISNLHFVPFQKTMDQHLWLDLSTGHLCYNRNFIIKIDVEPTEKDIFRIPLPEEIIQVLNIKFRKKKHADNLAQLFDKDILQLKRDARRYCFHQSLTSHIASLTRLGKSYSRFLLHECSDEIYSSLISLDFSICELANVNYFVAKADRINQICTNAYQKIGLSGQLYSPVSAEIGSLLGMQSSNMVEMLNASLSKANNAISSLSTRTDFNTLLGIHATVAESILLLCVASGGLRSSKHGYAANHQFDYERGTMLISDKYNSTYNLWRLIPLATFVLRWLETYQFFLQILAKRLSSKDKKLSEAIGQLSVSNGLAEIPPFFKYDSLKLAPLTTRDIKNIFDAYVLKANAGRHGIDFSLRATLGNVLINCMMGRASLGQEAFGVRSCLSPEFAFNQIRTAMDDFFVNAHLPEPVSISGYPFLKKKIIDNNFYRTVLAQKRDLLPKNKNAFEDCPFHEFTLLHAKYFENVVHLWKKEPIQSSNLDLIISLVANDGVVLESELFEAIYGVFFEKIYKIGDLFALDVSNETIGKRRVYLSQDTLLILNQLRNYPQASPKTPVNLMSKQIVAEFKNEFRRLHLDGYTLLPTLHDFLRSATAYFSLVFPPTLRAWNEGKVNARTRRIESVARHHTYKPEPERFIEEKNSKNRRVNSDRELINVLHIFSSKTEHLGSNQKRTHALKEAVLKIQHNLILAEDRLLADFILYLIDHCKEINSPNTINNHYFNLRNLLSDLPPHFLETEEFDPKALEAHLNAAENFTQTKAATLNYFFQMLNLKVKIKSTTQEIKPYSELISLHEINEIKKHILQSRYEPVIRLQAAAMREVMSSSALRAEDITTLRSCDVHLGSNRPSYIYFTLKTVGTKKTANADRLIIDDQNQWLNFKKLVEIVRKSHPDQSKAAIFSCPDNISSFKHAQELMAIISSACKSITGAVTVRPHTFRSTHISNAIYQGCQIDTQKKFSPLALRLYLKELSVSAGHGDELTTVSEYCSVMDKLRREWMDYVTLKQPTHPHHTASILDKNKESTAKSLKVNSAVHLKSKALNKLHAELKNRIVPVETFITDSNHHIDTNEEVKEAFKLHAYAWFTTLSVLGYEEVVVRHLANLETSDFDNFVESYAAYSAALKTTWYASLNKSVGLTLEKPLLHIMQNFATLDLNLTEIFTISHAFPSDLCAPWLFNQQELNTLLNTSILGKILAAGFEVVLTVAKSIEQSIHQFHGYGFSNVEVSKKSSFSRQKVFKVTLFPKGTSRHARPRKLKLAMLTITATLIARFCAQVGVQNEQ